MECTCTCTPSSVSGFNEPLRLLPTRISGFDSATTYAPLAAIPSPTNGETTEQQIQDSSCLSYRFRLLICWKTMQIYITISYTKYATLQNL